MGAGFGIGMGRVRPYSGLNGGIFSREVLFGQLFKYLLRAGCWSFWVGWKVENGSFVCKKGLFWRALAGLSFAFFGPEFVGGCP